jgi:hypothetical protein
MPESILSVEPNDVNFIFKSNKLTVKEIATVAILYRRELPFSFLGSLDNEFLELLLTHIATNENGVIVLALDPDTKRVVGFDSVAVDMTRIYMSFLRQHGLRAFFMLASHILSLNRLRRMMETLFYPARRKAPPNLPKAEGLALAIDRSYRGTLLATMLHQKMVEELRQRGIPAYKAFSHVSFHRTHAFFKKLGAKQVGTMEMHKGEESLIFVFQVLPEQNTCQ